MLLGVDAVVEELVAAASVRKGASWLMLGSSHSRYLLISCTRRHRRASSASTSPVLRRSYAV
jgi:superoxide dismutase